MEKRKLGNTGLEVSLLGFGGFHLLEIPQKEATFLLNSYLDKGGNYIETAFAYGEGESERKVGQAIKSRRDDVVLVTKTPMRDGPCCAENVVQSLRNLNTDHIDLLLMHAVATEDDLNKILASGGAFQEALKLKEQGKIGHIGLSMHGQPDILISALHRAPFEAVMTTINYYDVNNFPKIQRELVPLANAKDVGIILMKPLADGLLWKNPIDAFNWSFSQPVSVIVTGMNNREMLSIDMDLAENFVQLSKSELERIRISSPELGNYVCRQCGICDSLGPVDFKASEIFLLEGLYDRQMRTGVIKDTGDFALRDRLRFWFDSQKRAQEEYAQLPIKGDIPIDEVLCKNMCPYGIDIPYKLRLADYKLAGKESY